MQRIGDSTSTANASKEFTRGQPGTGAAATLITVEWLNAVQRELVNIISASGMNPTPADDSQLLKAVAAMIEIRLTWAGVGSKPSTVAGFGISDAYTKTEVSAAIQSAINGLVAAAPGALDTLKELADALGGDANFAATITSKLANKLAVGQYGLGASVAPTTGVDTIGIPGGFYYYGPGATGFANYVGLINIPYGDSGYSAQLGFLQGSVEPDIAVRGCSAKGVWGNTRKLWHTGNLDPSVILPPGTTIQYAGSTPPPGFLPENGTAVSRTVYAALFAAIGTRYGAGDGSTTFNLPDSRGEFIRGADSGRGVDPGRAVGTFQADQMQGHQHALFWGQGAAGSSYAGNNVTNYASASTYSQVSGAVTDGANGTPRIGSETRPRNTSRLFCIKY